MSCQFWHSRRARWQGLRQWLSDLWSNGALMGLVGALLCLALLVYGVD